MHIADLQMNGTRDRQLDAFPSFNKNTSFFNSLTNSNCKTTFNRGIIRILKALNIWLKVIVLALLFHNPATLLAGIDSFEKSTLIAINPPSGLAAYRLSSKEILLQWNDPSNGTYAFELERKKGALGIYEKIDDISAGITEYSDFTEYEDVIVFYRVRAVQNLEASTYSNEVRLDLTKGNHFIPEEVKLSRRGNRPVPTYHRAPITIGNLNVGNTFEVFQAPPCLQGEYFVGFKLYYDLGDFNTKDEWVTRLEVTLLDGEVKLWTKTLQVDLKSQTFLSTIFHDVPLSCKSDYKFKITTKEVTGPVPQSNVWLMPLLYPKKGNFNPSQSINLQPITNTNGLVLINWNHEESVATLEYDVEWVYFEEHEIVPQGQDPFVSKEPIRITTGAKSYSHLTYYPDGELYYRVRAVGYNPEFPNHRIPGQWQPGNKVPIENQDTTKNWQLQTIFAEEGNYKKIMQYYDGSLRLRQSLTNLNSLGLTLVGESLYDFEGRKAIDIMPVPADNALLKYQENFNKFDIGIGAVAGHTDTYRRKFHYDNSSLENSTISNEKGAGKYYSSLNNLSGIHKYIPDAEGYVYSQTVYTQDGTGRVSKQSGPGKIFRTDAEPNRATRYFYGEAAPVELKRLFGNNVGNADHYKKNMVVDGNNQVSVSYLDQEGKVIATALAGKSPESVESLPSYKSLNPSKITVDISDKNHKKLGKSTTSHKILNESLGNEYTFQYNLSALAADMASFGCQECKFDLKITLTSPEGKLISLGKDLTGNEDKTDFSYLRKGITAACSNSAAIAPIIITVSLTDLGDYTLTKTLVPHELSFTKMKTIIESQTQHQQNIKQISESYILDASQCETCVDPQECPEVEQAIETAIVEIGYLDCENILTNIKEDIYKKHGREIEITEEILSQYAQYCQYKFCLKNQQSDVFEKQMSRIANWSAAVVNGYNNSINIDPFFAGELSGAGSKTSMQGKLDNIFIANVNNQPINGSILELTDPANTAFYLNENGEKNVNGKHLLFWNLMSEKDNMTPEAYQKALNEQRWTLYKSFYLESKRKTKIELAEVQSCPALLSELKLIDELPWDKTEEEIIAWGKKNGVNDSVSDEQLEMTIANIENVCDFKFNETDRASVKSNLRTYFNGNDRNFFRFILKEDVGVNQNLNNIQSVVGSGCSLNSVAVDDPLVCGRESSIFLPDYQNNEMQTLSSNYGEEQSDFKGLYNNSKESPSTEANDPGTMNTLSSLPPSPEEYQALLDFYHSTGGINWGDNYSIGWKDAGSQPQNVSGWYGIKTNATGGVVELNSGLMKLNGVIPNSVGDLVNLKILNISGTGLTGAIPESLKKIENLEELRFSSTNFTGNIPDFLKFLPKLRILEIIQRNNKTLSGNLNLLTTNNLQLVELYLGGINLDQEIPSNINKLSLLKYLWLLDCNLRGIIPDKFGDLSNLVELDLYQNDLYVSQDNPLFKLNNLTWLGLNGNRNYEGDVAQLINSLSKLKTLDIERTKFFGNFPVTDISINYRNFWFRGCNFTFSNFLDLKKVFKGVGFAYLPQKPIDSEKTHRVQIGTSITLTTQIDRNTSTPSKYRWLKLRSDGSSIVLNNFGYNSHTYIINNVSMNDAGQYYYQIINDDALNGPLTSKIQTLLPFDAEPIKICLEYNQNNPTLALMNYKVDWNTEIAKCLAREQKKDSFLIEYSKQKYIEQQASTLYNSFRTNCLNKVTESLKYSYTSREYHYTLYYYDQAKNLVQTVPPNGVNTATQAHTLATNYKYNSLNQLVWQKTPDGGESNFWYNSMGQLRLSQNAKQKASGHYSFSKYDALGRIIEVGELEAATLPQDLKASLDIPEFPLAANYPLREITRTHYDRAHPTLGAAFAQENLRSRVSWVEVIDDKVATFYNYDIHGNVKSVLQKLPGLEDKRTDYIYDLVSGNVNYVIYQFDKEDQFVHRYEYDEDNRIREVYTSIDRYIWDKEAEYAYYQHGPLARVELGQHNVQNLDYIYTLQGWIKGVNMPYDGDPGKNGVSPSKVPKDAFAYTLGYFNGDYKAIGAGIPHYDTRDQLWARNKEVNGTNHEGLYNGNISWMVTDLPSVGQAANNRAKGMQAMLYKYDQLNRITKARSLTNYTPGSGFTARSTNPAAYDVDYSYDPNGNLLTLLRRDQNGGVLNDFNYEYYSGTNKLMRVEAVKDPGGQHLTEMTYYDTPLKPDGNYYERIYVEGAEVPNSHKAELKATKYVLLKDGFTAEAGSNFSASIIAPGDIPAPDVDTNYTYDEIGNLISDKNEGIEKITWTPHGKIRSIVKKNGLTIGFKYDGNGNRVERWSRDKGGSGSHHYVRDASGNVMAIYKKEELIEQPIYGSSRLGIYKGGRRHAHRTLGSKNYELSNHLGNVLAVVTDNIQMNADSASATVVSTSDYYPFGLAMGGRSWNNWQYRYGFNGMEKDDEIKFGSSYDFGARIYDARIGRWLSGDKYEGKYPSHSPYNFAINDPLFYVDIDGNDKTTYYTLITDEGEIQFQVVTKNDVMFEYVYSKTEKDMIFVASHVQQHITLDLRTNIKPNEDMSNKGEEMPMGWISGREYFNQKGTALMDKGMSQPGGFNFVAKSGQGWTPFGSQNKAEEIDIEFLFNIIQASSMTRSKTFSTPEMQDIISAAIGAYEAAKEAIDDINGLDASKKPDLDLSKFKKASEYNTSNPFGGNSSSTEIKGTKLLIHKKYDKNHQMQQTDTLNTTD